MTVHVFAKGYAGIAKSFHHILTESWPTVSLHHLYRRAIQGAYGALRPIPPVGTTCYFYVHVVFRTSDGRLIVHDLPVCDFMYGRERIEYGYKGHIELPKV